MKQRHNYPVLISLFLSLCLSRATSDENLQSAKAEPRFPLTFPHHHLLYSSLSTSPRSDRKNGKSTRIITYRFNEAKPHGKSRRFIFDIGKIDLLGVSRGPETLIIHFQSSANLPVLLFDLTNNVDQAEPITINDKSGNTIATVTREALSCLLRRSESYNEVQESYMQHSRTGVPQIIDVSLPQASYHDSGTPYGHVPPLVTHSSQLLPKIPRQSNHHELDFASQPGQSVIQCAPQQPFCQSDEVPPSKSIRKSIRLNNREEIKDLIKSTLNACPQNVLKPILKTAVKFIEPEKQRKWPYVLSEDPVKQTKTIKHRRAVGVDGKLQPPWWPTDIRHREPDHLYKQECVDLGIGLLCYMIDNKGLNHKHGDEAIKKYWKLQVKQLLPALMDSCVSSIGKDTSTDANKRFEARRGERQRKADLWHHGIIQLFQVLFLLSDVKHDRIGRFQY